MIKTIHVIQEDIDKGRRRDSLSCPIALAIRRECNPYSVYVITDRIVWGNSFSLYVGSSSVSYFPSFITQKILLYDGGINIEPFEFDVVIPDEVVCNA